MSYVPASRRAWSRLDPYAGADRFAGDCARAAILSESEALTIEEICREIRCPMPISGDDLRALAHTCERWGIRTVLDGDVESWESYKAEVIR